MTNPFSTNALLGQVQGASTANGLLLPATVETTPPQDLTLTVLIDGSTTIINAQNAFDGYLQEGDRVWVEKLGSVAVIMGRQNSIQSPNYQDTGWHYIGHYDDAQWGSGVSLYNSAYTIPRYRKDPGGIVHLEGLIENSNSTLGATLFTLPPGFRPAYNLAFPILNNTPSSGAIVMGRIDVQPSGAVLIQVAGNGAGGTGWIGLDNIVFAAEDVPNPPDWTIVQSSDFTSPWTNYPASNGFAPARYFIDDAGDVHLSGLVAAPTAPTTNTSIFNLPSGYYRGDVEELYLCYSAGGFNRIDIMTTGAVNYVVNGVGTPYAYLSLEGIVIPGCAGNMAWNGIGAYANSWVPYGTPYAGARYYFNKWGKCYASGLIKSGVVNETTTGIGTYIAATPIAPTFHKVFPCFAAGAAGRLDLNGQQATGVGAFYPESFGSGNNGWVNLANAAWWPNFTE